MALGHSLIVVEFNASLNTDAFWQQLSSITFIFYWSECFHSTKYGATCEAVYLIFTKCNLFMQHLWKNLHNHKAELYAHYICQSWSEIRWRIGGTVTKMRKCRKWSDSSIIITLKDHSTNFTFSFQIILWLVWRYILSVSIFILEINVIMYLYIDEPYSFLLSSHQFP